MKDANNIKILTLMMLQFFLFSSYAQSTFNKFEIKQVAAESTGVVVNLPAIEIKKLQFTDKQMNLLMGQIDYDAKSGWLLPHRYLKSKALLTPSAVNTEIAAIVDATSANNVISKDEAHAGKKLPTGAGIPPQVKEE